MIDDKLINENWNANILTKTNFKNFDKIVFKEISTMCNFLAALAALYLHMGRTDRRTNWVIHDYQGRRRG